MSEARPAKLDPEAVDAELNPGLRVPVDHDEEVITEPTADGDKDATIYTWTEVAEIETANWRAGNPEYPDAEFGHEEFRIRFKITDPESVNKNRRVADQFLHFHMNLVNRSYDELRALKNQAPKGAIERRLTSFKYNTIKNMKFMTSLLRALGFTEVLSAAKKSFYGFDPLFDAGLIDNGGDMLRGIPVRITIEKGRPNYKTGAGQELVTKVTAL